MQLVDHEFYIFPEEVYRIGNSGSHRLPVIRATEITTSEIKGVKMVVANNRGVSVYTLEGLKKEQLTGFAWLFKKNTHVVPGLKLVSDDKPGHYVLAPAHSMPIDKYKGLLEEMGIKCNKYFKVKKDGSMVRVA